MMNVTTGALLVFLLTFQQLHGNAFSKSIGMSVENSSKTNAEKHGNDTHSDKHLEPHKIKVAKFDFDNIATPFVVALWVLLASLLKLGFHMSHRLSKFVPESCVIILLGVLLGGLFDLIDYEEHVTKLPFFTSRIFFLFLLPPIVLEAGYFLHTRAFFDNIGTILLYAVVGTIFNTFTVGLTLFACTDLNISLIQMLLFSCLIAAVDPVAVLAVFEEVHVNEVLYILVFGESLLNDAVTVVLYRLFEALVTQETIKVEEVFVGVAAFFVVSLGGIIIGIFWGFLTAFLTKYTDHVRVLEPIFVFGMSYMSYLNAELFHFSGIISIVTCAIVMKPYVEVNISQKSRIPVKYFMKMASSLSETIIFMLLGVIIFNRRLEFRAGFIFLTILFITIYRSLGVVLLTWLANKIGRLNKLGKVDQFVMAYGGLRGAVAFSLATLIDENHVPAKTIMETTTIVVVFFTVFFQGTTIKPIVDLLKVKRSVKRKEIMLGEVNDKMLDHLLGGIQDVIQHRGHYYWKNLYQYVDVKYLRRWFMRHSRHQAIDETVLSVYRKISHREAMTTEKQRILSGFSESDEYERVVKDRGLFSALAPCKLESGVNEKYKDMYSHVQLAVLLGKPRKGSIHRFSRNNILDETDICDDALRIRRCSRSQAPRHMISKQTSRESANGDGGEKKRRNGHHRPRHNRGHRRHGHRCHVKHRQQKLHKQLSDIVESPITVVPPEIPDQDLHPEDDINEASEEQEDKVSSASESPTESRVLLPKLADIEPSSPTRDNHLMGTDEPAVTVNIPSGSASPGGVDETTM